MNSSIVIPSAIAAIVVVGALGFYLAYEAEQQNLNAQQRNFEPEKSVFSSVDTTIVPSTIAFEGTQQLKKFSSEDELKDFLTNIGIYGRDHSGGIFTGDVLLTGLPMPPRPTLQGGFQFSSDDGAVVSMPFRESGPVPTAPVVVPGPFDSNGAVAEKSPDYSSTNIQVTGVDEPDFLKTDGNYIYIVKDHSLTIVDAHPADEAEIVVKIALDIEPQELQNMFLNKDRLVVFYYGFNNEETIAEFEYRPRHTNTPVTHVMILDVSDKEKPKILKDYQIDGDFADARMIGDYVYFISTMWVDYHAPIIPHVVETASNAIILRPDVFYFDNLENNYNFNTITAINMFDENFINSETFLMGSANTIYVSQDGFYVTYQKNLHYSYYDSIKKDKFFDVVVPLLPKPVQDKINQINNDSALDSGQKWIQVSELLQETYNKMSKQDKKWLFDEIEKNLIEYDSKIREDARKTVIHKILLDDGDLKYQTKGEVPGWLLNQFSMDEYGDRFRVATTNEYITFERGSTQYNSVYVMNRDDLSIVGSIEDLAKDESIFSARFMGDRLYLVTFEIIDPFFVIDLSTDQPKVLGELKIPGFSNYLHPYDEDHVIGIGRDTKESSGRVQELGVKIALFDVSDVNNPSVLDDIVIGDAATYSAALHNHKAFLFDKNKNVLSIPIEGITHGMFDSDEMTQYRGDDNRWYGFYVYGLDTQNGFDLKGKIDHAESKHSYLPSGPRSLYIDDVLYTVSANLIKMNDLDNIENEINSIDLGPKGQIIEYLK